MDFVYRSSFIMWFPGSRKGSRIAGLLALSPALFSTTVTAADPCKAICNAIETGVKKGKY